MTFVDLSGLEKDILCDTNLKRISHFDSNSVYLKIIFYYYIKLVYFI